MYVIPLIVAGIPFRNATVLEYPVMLFRAPFLKFMSVLDKPIATLLKFKGTIAVAPQELSPVAELCDIPILIEGTNPPSGF
jgi:hypothetical protein